jgi:hypothetical protein
MKGPRHSVLAAEAAKTGAVALISPFAVQVSSTESIKPAVAPPKKSRRVIPPCFEEIVTIASSRLNVLLTRSAPILSLEVVQIELPVHQF